MIGTTVGSYRIAAQISVGGMGTVYRAEHTLIGRIAAVKVLHPEMCGNPDIVSRFFNEAKATTAIKHPGIVEIFDFGYMPSGHAFIVMEFLDGAPLSHRITERGTFPEPEAALLMRGVCNALAAAHAKGIVHRDLKPDNIFVVPDADSPLGERTKVLDFGIAKLTDVGLAGSATKTGAVMGTPTYMSPEQCSGRGQVDHRADLYSIGCMLYEMLSGRPPFTNDGAGELIGSHLFVEPERISAHARVSPEMERLVMSLLAKRPEQRVQTATDLSQLLMQIAQQHGWVSHTTDPLGRFSQSNIPASMLATRPSLERPATGQPTPIPTPAAPRTYTAPSQAEPPKPTTLSGAASQTHDVAQPPRSRRGVVIVASAALAIAAGVVMFLAVGRGGGTTSEPSPGPAVVTPATSPASGTTSPPAVTAPASGTEEPATTTATGTTPASGTATAPPSTTANTLTDTPSTTATTATGTAPASGTAKPAIAVTTTTAKPTTTKPTTAKPMTTKPATTKPATTKPATTKPATTKPAVKPVTKPTKPKGGDLLETDI